MDKNGKFPWRNVDEDVCALLVRLAGDHGSVTVLGPKITSASFHEDTGPEKTGFSLLEVKQGALLQVGASARCFRRSQ